MKTKTPIQTRQHAPRAPWACLAASLMALLMAPKAGAQVTDCAAGDPTYPCEYQIQRTEVQKVPALFKFQSRISQAKLPVGDAVFETLLVRVKSGQQTVCQEQFNQVMVRDSVLNLEIGRNIDCELDEIMAQYNDLSFQVCIGSGENCLKPIALSTVPYAVKASYAAVAQEADKANQAAECHYAHRVTADPELFVTHQLGKGYFDFQTPTQPELLFDGISVPATYADGGYILWSPVSPTEPNLHIAARALDTGAPERLDELVLHADYTKVLGTAVIQGDSTVDPNALIVDGDSLLDGGLEVTGATLLSGPLSVGAQENLNTQAMDVYHSVHFHGDVQLDQPLSASIPPNSITGVELAPGAVGSEHIGAGQVGSEQLAEGAVTSVHLADKAVTGAHLAEGAVSGDKIADGAVTGAKIKADSVDTYKIMDGAVQKSDIALNSVDSARIIDGQVSRYDLADDSVTGSKIAPLSVGTSELLDGSVTNNKLSLAVTEFHTSGHTSPWTLGSQYKFCAQEGSSVGTSGGYCYVYRSGYLWIARWNASWCRFVCF